MTSAEWEAVLTDDGALQNWALTHVLLCNAGAVDVIVRAGTYSQIHYRQEMYPRDGAPIPDKSDPRRPVIMRGARELLISKYSTGAAHIANGWCNRIINRYLHSRRYTCYDRAEHHQVLDQLRSKLSRRYRNRLSYTFWNYPHCSAVYESDGYRSYWKDGKYFYLERTTQTAPVARPLASKIAVKERSPSPSRLRPTIATRIRRERLVLRAVYELGLIQPGDLS